VLRKWIFFALVTAAVLGADLATKAWALKSLGLGEPTRFAGGILPLTLHFNTGGLWGMGSGGGARWFFVVATAIALVVLFRLFRDVETGQTLRRWTLPMIAGGALGNLVDRLRWDRGVVDFLGPFDLGFMVWPIFNVADMAISCCTLLLVFSLWRQDLLSRRAETSAAAAP
jgi:signal peptidase II